MAEMEKLREKAYGILRWSEKYIKTDMVYVASGGFWLFFGQATAALFSLLLAIAFANLIEPEKYGNYKYVLSLAGIIGALTLTGLGTAVTRAVARGHEGTLRHAYKLSLLWSAGMVLVSAAGGAYYLWNGNIFLGLSLFAIGAASPIVSAASLYRPFLIGKRDFKRASLYGLIQGAVPTFAVLTALLLKAPLFVLVLSYFAANAVTVWFLFERTARLTNNKEVDEITDHLGKHLSVIGLLSTIGGKLDSILIFQFLGGTELAIFSLATTLPDSIRGSLKHIASLATPKFAQKTKEEMKAAIWSKMKIIFLATLAIVVAYVTLAPYLFAWLFPLYQESVIYSQVYAFSLLISLVLASAYWDAQAAVKERYILNIIVNIATVGSSLIGVLFFGLWGAILARIFAKAVSIGLTMYLINRH